jgi:hypothetical protein
LQHLYQNINNAAKKDEAAFCMTSYVGDVAISSNMVSSDSMAIVTDYIKQVHGVYIDSSRSSI